MRAHWEQNKTTNERHVIINSDHSLAHLQRSVHSMQPVCICRVKSHWAFLAKTKAATVVAATRW
jgi:hypothetical protein